MPQCPLDLGMMRANFPWKKRPPELRFSLAQLSKVSAFAITIFPSNDVIENVPDYLDLNGMHAE